MRVYKTMYDALNETARDLKVRGISVECNTYQDKKLYGEDRFVKELIGVDFKIDKPLLDRDKAVKYIFKDEEETQKIIKYCKQEIKDRCSGKPLNPGNSYKIRSDMWNKFLESDNRFSYQYAERLWTNDQFKTVIEVLKNDAGTRQAVLSVWNPSLDMDIHKVGGGNSSNDFLGHHVIDLYCASGLMEYVVKELKSTYPNLKVGSLTYMGGSLHAFHWNLKDWVLF